MGGRNLKLVWDALEGADISVPDEKGGYRHFGMCEMLLMSAIASHQRDPDKDYREEDCICYGDVSTMARASWQGKSTVCKSRDFLLKSGLIYFFKSKKVKNVTNPSKERRYTNVYTLNIPRLWQLKDEKRAKLSDRETKLSDVEEKRSDVEKKFYHVDTNINKNIKENSTTIPHDGDDAFIVRDYMARTLNIPKEKIFIDGVRKAIEGKDMNAVLKTTDAFADRCKKSSNLGIGALINEVKFLPRMPGAKRLSDEEMKKLFSAPVAVRTEEPAGSRRERALQEGFERMKIAFEFTSQDDAQDNERLKASYHRRFDALHADLVAAHVETFIKDTATDFGEDPAAFCDAHPNLRKRLDLVCDELDKGANDQSVKSGKS